MTKSKSFAPRLVQISHRVSAYAAWRRVCIAMRGNFSKVNQMND